MKQKELSNGTKNALIKKYATRDPVTGRQLVTPEYFEGPLANLGIFRSVPMPLGLSKLLWNGYMGSLYKFGLVQAEETKNALKDEDEREKFQSAVSRDNKSIATEASAKGTLKQLGVNKTNTPEAVMNADGGFQSPTNGALASKVIDNSGLKYRNFLMSGDDRANATNIKAYQPSQKSYAMFAVEEVDPIRERAAPSTENAKRVKDQKTGRATSKVDDEDHLPAVTLISLLEKAANKVNTQNSIALAVERAVPPESQTTSQTWDLWQKWTYNEYYDLSRRLAKSFLLLGLKQYSSVCIFCNNSPEWSI